VGGEQRKRGTEDDTPPLPVQVPATDPAGPRPQVRPLAAVFVFVEDWTRWCF
jgi:hypothetical protein